MAHEVESMMYVTGVERFVPWHGLGTSVEEAVNSAEALKLAGIDKMIKRVQKHMDEYIESHPEANEDFKKTRAKVLEYKKNNPDKLNPKDYK